MINSFSIEDHHYMTRAILLAKKLNININFAAIQGTYPNENFFEYPLLSIKKWNEFQNKWEKEVNKNDTNIKISGFEGLSLRHIKNKTT